MSNTIISICDTKENIIFFYESSVIPRKGELVNLTHYGTFRILDVAYRLEYDQERFGRRELLMYVEVIIDKNSPIKEFNYTDQEKM